MSRAKDAPPAIGEGTESSADDAAPQRSVVSMSRGLRERAGVSVIKRDAAPGYSPDFPFAALPAPSLPAQAVERRARDYLVSLEEFMEMAGVTEEGYLRMKAMGDGPREVVRLREEVFVTMHDLDDWLARSRDSKPSTPP